MDDGCDKPHGGSKVAAIAAFVGATPGAVPEPATSEPAPAEIAETPEAAPVEEGITAEATEQAAPEWSDEVSLAQVDPGQVRPDSPALADPLSYEIGLLIVISGAQPIRDHP